MLSSVTGWGTSGIAASSVRLDTEVSGFPPVGPLRPEKRPMSGRVLALLDRRLQLEPAAEPARGRSHAEETAELGAHWRGRGTGRREQRRHGDLGDLRRERLGRGSWDLVR